MKNPIVEYLNPHQRLSEHEVYINEGKNNIVAKYHKALVVTEEENKKLENFLRTHFVHHIDETLSPIENTIKILKELDDILEDGDTEDNT